MRIKATSCMTAVVGFVLLAIPVFAHHGTAAYDTSKEVTLKATVTGFEFVNPHVQIFFDVKDTQGNVEKWQGALTSPNHLARSGWSKSSLKLGEQVTIAGYRAKNGAASIWITKILDSDGHELKLTPGDS